MLYRDRWLARSSRSALLLEPGNDNQIGEKSSKQRESGVFKYRTGHALAAIGSSTRRTKEKSGVNGGKNWRGEVRQGKGTSLEV